MSWKEPFSKGIASFNAGRHGESLEQFTEEQALKYSSEKQYIIYDSRSAVFDRMDKPKEALRDAKRTIDLAPNRWQGYARAARLFFKCLKLESSLAMVNMALERVKADDAKRRVELSSLKEEIRNAKQADEKRHRLAQNQFAKLPVELFAEIFRISTLENLAALITLRKVCSHWRAVAGSIPSLWDTLLLTGRQPARKAQLWVAHSKGKIRELHVQSAAAHHHSHWEEGLAPIVWENLRVCKIEAWDIVKYLGQIDKLHVLSNLERLEVDDSHDFAHIDRGKLLVENSLLRRLTLNHTLLRSWSSSFSHLTNLVHLSMHIDLSAGGTSIVPILEQNQLLETLIIDLTPTRFIVISQVPMEIESAHLPRLTRLELSSVAFASKFLESVNMPKLQTLRLNRCPLLLDSGLLAIAEKHPSFLTEFSIQSSVVNSGPVVQILRASPELQILELTHIEGIANEVLEVLAPISSPLSIMPSSTSTNTPVEGESICPSLTHVNLSNCRDLKTGPLERLVKSRLPRAAEEVASGEVVESASPSMAAISSLAVNTCPEVDAARIPWFRKNVRSFSCVYMTKKAASYRR